MNALIHYLDVRARAVLALLERRTRRLASQRVRAPSNTSA